MKKIINTSNLLPSFEELFNSETMEKMVIRPEANALVKKINGGENLYIFVGSSGAGRDTILEECFAKFKNAVRLRRTTTRKPREQVKDQKRLIFITEKAFIKDFEKGEILFAGRYKANQQLYGISKKEILKLVKQKNAPHFLEENFSGLSLKVMLPKAKLIIVLPPTVDVLKDRLFSRDKSEEECEKRFRTSLLEIKAVIKNLKQMIKMGFVDMVIVNEGFPEEVGERVFNSIKKNSKRFEDYAKLTDSLK